MDFIDPPVDFAGMARSLGLEAIRISDPRELKSKLSDAFNRPGAKLIEVMVSNAVN
jgi:benzoylformate decarboxylase